MSEEAPNFVHEEGHEWKEGEKIYVIDSNKYDIYEAEIKAIKTVGTKTTYDIHYPEYPDDDFTIKTPAQLKRMLVQNDENKKIFEEQEKVRAAKDAEEEENGEEEKKEEAEEKKEEEKKEVAEEKKEEKAE